MGKEELVREAARLVREARSVSAFTGAGISVESGIPPFRGENGLWSRYDPGLFEIDYFTRHPARCWELLRELFYRTFQRAEPNPAHRALASLEREGLLRSLVTQNIDNLHHRAGSRRVVEYHGNSRTLVCLACGKRLPVTDRLLESIPPRCACGGLLKPDFVFFGELIPPDAAREAARVASHTDLMLVIGTTGEVYPAALVPRDAHSSGAGIVEINPSPSAYTGSITGLFLQGPAAVVLDRLHRELLGREVPGGSG
ncbi:MAG: SIR2 family NAD-dependent protein deacylase [Spirochaetota bacterium]